MKNHEYCVYIMTNWNNSVLYTGVTNNLQRRILEHRAGNGSQFCKKYKICKLVYYEVCDDIQLVIYREKQIKAGSRKKKVDLIQGLNPEWKDLYLQLFE